MLRSIPALVTFIFIASACDSKPPQPTRALSVRSECPPIAEDVYYFPEGAIARYDARIDQDNRSAYARFLRAAGATSLSCGAHLGEAYRLMWLAHGRPATIVEIRSTTSGAQLIAADFANPQLADPWTVVGRVEKELTSSEVEHIRSTVQQIQFFTLPEWRDYRGNHVWVLEGRARDKYHVVSRTLIITTRDAEWIDVYTRFFELLGRPLPPE